MDAAAYGAIFIIIFFASWFFVTVYARSKGQSRIEAVGGGFLVSCVSLVVLFVLLDIVTKEDFVSTSPKPANQEAFVSVVSKHIRQYRGTENELRRRQFREQRKKEVGKILDGFEVSGWIGTVEKIGSNMQGRGVLVIRLARNIEIKTWNNFLSDVTHKTLIDQDTKLHSTLMRLNPGDKVSFSGIFFTCDNDYIYEGSITEQGSMIRPEFIMRFERVRPI